MPSLSPKQTILVVGAGFAGMWSALGALRTLRLNKVSPSEAEVILVSPEPTLVVRPRLYERNIEETKADLMELFNAVGVEYVRGYVEHIDVESKSIVYSCDGGKKSTKYNMLILASGSSVAMPSSVKGLQEHALMVDTFDDAAKLEKHLVGLKSKLRSEGRDTVVVVGSGLTGIETAAEMPERLKQAIGNDASAKTVIIEKNSTFSPGLGHLPRPVLLEAFEELGIEIRLGAGVVAVDEDSVVLDSGERIMTQTVVWTGGLRANALTESIAGVERDHLGRLKVDRNLKVTEGIYAAGDVAVVVTDDAGHLTLQSCQHALYTGKAAGNNAAADLLGKTVHMYKQERYGTCIDLGKWGGLFCMGWDRAPQILREEGKQVKRWINTELIYPPSDSTKALDEADPDYVDPGYVSLGY